MFEEFLSAWEGELPSVVGESSLCPRLCARVRASASWTKLMTFLLRSIIVVALLKIFFSLIFPHQSLINPQPQTLHSNKVFFSRVVSLALYKFVIYFDLFLIVIIYII